MYPQIHEIKYQNPTQVFAVFAEQQGAVLLQSAQLREGCGRYSYICVDPFHIVMDQGQDPFAALEQQLVSYSMQNHVDMPPFQGGVAGYWGYEAGHFLETLPLAALDEMQFPRFAFGFYDVVIAFDHEQRQAWIFSSGLPEQDVAARQKRAMQRIAEFKQKLQSVKALLEPSQVFVATEQVKANFTREHYLVAVQRVIDYILAGDIFEANLTQCFHAPMPADLPAFDLYRRLLAVNPAPFAAYLNFADCTIASASPERFIQLTQGQIETRPIKGTRPRGANQDQDAALAVELAQSEKDQAENVMIVDLLRNDLSRVCEDHSVQVPQLCGLETYPTVHHLVSVVRGKLRAEYRAIDVLRAAFPGGSITGAPKIRAMEIIAELEPTIRGPYCGSIGYIGFNGDMDTSITIRTFCIRNQQVTFQAGGAIVADSDPEQEYEETLAKVRALRRALCDSAD